LAELDEEVVEEDFSVDVEEDDDFSADDDFSEDEDVEVEDVLSAGVLSAEGRESVR
jgi:hypothetical protein